MSSEETFIKEMVNQYEEDIERAKKDTDTLYLKYCEAVLKQYKELLTLIQEGI